MFWLDPLLYAIATNRKSLRENVRVANYLQKYFGHIYLMN